VKNFSEDWELDFSSRPTLKYKRKGGIPGIYQRYFGRKHSVFAMYWFFKHEYLNNHDARKFHFPLKHDNIPVKGVPFKYELHGTWWLEDEDLKILYGGPLIDQHLEVLVQAETKLNKMVRLCQIATPPIALTSAVLGVVVKWPSLLALF